MKVAREHGRPPHAVCPACDGCLGPRNPYTPVLCVLQGHRCACSGRVVGGPNITLNAGGPLDVGPLRELLYVAVRANLAVLDVGELRTTLQNRPESRYVAIAMRLPPRRALGGAVLAWVGTICCKCVGVLTEPHPQGIMPPWPMCACPVPVLDPKHVAWLV